MGTPILFSPDNVKAVLTSLPSVAALLPDPAVEGVNSEAFPGVLRKTQREVYRWIANTHYQHLADVVPVLERVHAAGCVFGHLLKTRDRDQFVSHTAEVFVADDLLRRGYTVNTLIRSAQVRPDLHVTSDGSDVAVEVYSPRELLAVGEWVREVSDLLSYADVGASYRSSVETIFEKPMPPNSDLLDPWAPAEMLAQTRGDVIARITEDVEKSLRDLAPLENTYRHTPTSLTTKVTLCDVEPATTAGPVRQGSVSYPGFSGYSPTGVFRTIVERSLKKARKRQAQGVAAGGHVLVVYLMGTQIAQDLVHPAHLGAAEATLKEIEPLEHGLDAIVFTVRALPQGLAAILTVADDTKLPVATVNAMFGQAP